MRHLPRLASLVLDQHHAILPSVAETILSVLDGRIGDIDFEALTPDQPTANAFVGRPVFGKDERFSGYRITDKGVAIVPVHGELVNRGAWVGASSGLVSYEGLRHTLRQAANDPAVRAIVMDMNSPGGMVAGMPETAATVRDIAKIKPVIAVANDMMASAAYGIASGATKIIASDTAMVGSIGTLYVHTDRSKALEKAGLKVTLIHAGARKVEGNSMQPLPDDVRQRIQERTQKLQASFIGLVQAGRPQLSEAAIRATEADVYFGAEAVDQGLADAVGTFDGAVAEAESGAVKPRLTVVPASQGAGKPPAPNSQPQPQKVAAMTHQTGAASAQADPGDWASQLTAPQLEAIAARLQETVTASTPAAATPPSGGPAAAAPAQPLATTTDEAFARGRAAERERISAILGSAEAKDRPAAAQVLATTSGDSADAIIAMLGKMPKETAASGAAAFYAAAAANGARPQVRHTAATEDVNKPSLADRQKAAVATMAASKKRA